MTGPLSPDRKYKYHDADARDWPPGFAVVFFCLLSCLFFWAGYKIVLQPLSMAQQSRNWPAADGIVIRSKSVYAFSKRGCGYRLDFGYQYTVGGRTYAGDNYIFGGGLCYRGPVAEVVKMHPAGQHVPVHYNPGNPAESVIVTGEISDNNRMGLYIFPVLTILPLVLLVYIRQTIKKHRRERRRSTISE